MDGKRIFEVRRRIEPGDLADIVVFEVFRRGASEKIGFARLLAPKTIDLRPLSICCEAKIYIL